MAATTGVILSQKGGDVGRVVQKAGNTLCAPHMDGDWIRPYLGWCRKVESADVLETSAPEEGPVAIWAGVNLESELENENHRSTAKYVRGVLKKGATDVAMGRTIVFTLTQA